MDSRDFMLEEYKYHLHEFERSEEIGERRVNIFLTLVTAIFGALGIFFKESDYCIKQYILIIIPVLLAMLIFGYLTLVRIVHRNLESHKALRTAGRIRRYFADKDWEIVRYLYYGPYDDKPMREIKAREIKVRNMKVRDMKRVKDYFSFGTGGLVQTVMLINSFIAAVLTALIIYYLKSSYLISGIASILGISLAWIFQFEIVKARYQKGRPKMSDIRYPTEIEAAFLIVSDRPQDTLDRIAKLSSLGGYNLRSMGTKIILDHYFDTPGHDLQDIKFALRIRQVDDEKPSITLKGPSRSIPGGGVERLEIDEEWSNDALRTVLKVLKNKKINISSSKESIEIEKPIEALRSYDLDVVQKRTTNREVRNVVPKIGDDRPVVAEMAIDIVRYLFLDGSTARIYQIEIEKKYRGSPLIMVEIADELKDEFKSEIRNWNYGKLATGKAIEKLLGEKKEIVDGEGNLNRDAYDLIEDYIGKNDENHID